MNEIQIFNYNSSEVRTIQKDGEPWFVLRDVCNVLGLGTPARVAERLDTDEVSQTHITDSMGRQQEMTIINESGLYNVILRSDKPEAKPFRKWVTYGNKAKRQANKIRGIAHSNEHKKKITSSLLKYYETHDSASIGRISEKRKGVVGVRNGESVQFQSVKDAAIAVNGSRANITRSCNSKTRKAYGYKWMWAGKRKEGADNG